MEVNGVSTACFVAQTEYFEVVSNKKNRACQKGLLAVKVLLQHHDLINSKFSKIKNVCRS